MSKKTIASSFLQYPFLKLTDIESTRYNAIYYQLTTLHMISTKYDCSLLEDIFYELSAEDIV